MLDGVIVPPWEVALTPAEHTLVLAALVVTALALLSPLVRIRFTADESRGVFRTASLNANSVVAVAFLSYLGLIAAFLTGYRLEGGLWRPGDTAQLAWAVRYMDWAVTVPLLMIELVAVSSLTRTATQVVRRVGMTGAVLMVASGFTGAFLVGDGRDFVAYAALGGLGAAFFGVLYVLVVWTLSRTLPRIPLPARTSYRSAVLLLLVTWLVYPVVYGIAGVTASAVWVVVGQLAYCAADLVAKIGFGTLVHRTAVLRSRAAEDADPSPTRRPRQPRADPVWVTDDRRLEFDEEDRTAP